MKFKRLIFLFLLIFSMGCFHIRLENVKQTKPGQASGDIVIKPLKE